MSSASRVAATVAGNPVLATDIDEREARVRSGNLASALPNRHTSEGRQLRRWVTQLIVAERVVEVEAHTRGLTGAGAPSEDQVLPDTPARLEIGSVAASTLAQPLARAVFAHVTADVEVGEDEVVAYHLRNPLRFAARSVAGEHGWLLPSAEPALSEVREIVTAHLVGAARLRVFRHWLDSRCAALVQLAPGFEHPGDPRQPDNTHRH